MIHPSPKSLERSMIPQQSKKSESKDIRSEIMLVVSQKGMQVPHILEQIRHHPQTDSLQELREAPQSIFRSTPHFRRSTDQTIPSDPMDSVSWFAVSSLDIQGSKFSPAYRRNRPLYLRSLLVNSTVLVMEYAWLVSSPSISRAPRG